MKRLELKEGWQMRAVGEENWQEAQVWGSIYTDLLRNGKMEDPYWRDNEDACCALMEKDYEYRCIFRPESTKEWGNVFLQFEGLDTLAEVFLNGQFLGAACNMHRSWEYQVKELLKGRRMCFGYCFTLP